MDLLTLYKGSDMLLELHGLTNEATGAFVNNASVSVTLRDEAGNAVGGETWPLAMSYVTSTNGGYRATLADTLGVAANARYVATVIADSGAGLRSQWEIDVICKTRRR